MEPQEFTDEDLAFLKSPPREVTNLPPKPPTLGREVEQPTKPPTEEPRLGRKALYPWNDWLDGEYHVLVRGRDFPEHQSKIAFAQQARNNAARRGGTVWIESSLEGIEMLGLQFFRTRYARMEAKYKAKNRSEELWQEVDEE